MSLLTEILKTGVSREGMKLLDVTLVSCVQYGVHAKGGSETMYQYLVDSCVPLAEYIAKLEQSQKEKNNE